VAIRILVVVMVLAFGNIVGLGQSKPSIQGVWRVAERTTTGPDGATNKNPQPGQWIFTAKHYSTVTDNSAKPRPLVEVLAPTAKLTDAQMIERYRDWAPITAQSGTYEISGTTLSLRPIAAKGSAVVTSKAGLSYQFKLDGNTLVLTSLTGPTGNKTANPTTIRLSRVE